MLFAAFLGYNPVQQLLGNVLTTLPPAQASYLTGRSFFEPRTPLVRADPADWRRESFPHPAQHRHPRP